MILLSCTGAGWIKGGAKAPSLSFEGWGPGEGRKRNPFHLAANAVCDPHHKGSGAQNGAAGRNCGFASSAPGGAKPQFPWRAFSLHEQRENGHYPRSQKTQRPSSVTASPCHLPPGEGKGGPSGTPAPTGCGGARTLIRQPPADTLPQGKAKRAIGSRPCGARERGGGANSSLAERGTKSGTEEPGAKEEKGRAFPC